MSPICMAPGLISQCLHIYFQNSAVISIICDSLSSPTFFASFVIFHFIQVDIEWYKISLYLCCISTRFYQLILSSSYFLLWLDAVPARNVSVLKLSSPSPTTIVLWLLPLMTSMWLTFFIYCTLTYIFFFRKNSSLSPAVELEEDDASDQQATSFLSSVVSYLCSTAQKQLRLLHNLLPKQPVGRNAPL